LFTEKAFGPSSIPAKMKWYWRAEAKYAATVKDLLEDYTRDGRFSFVLVHDSEVSGLLSAAASLDFQPLVRSGHVVMAVQRNRLPASGEVFDVSVRRQFVR
jgi:hypothetical protein